MKVLNLEMFNGAHPYIHSTWVCHHLKSDHPIPNIIEKITELHDDPFAVIAMLEHHKWERIDEESETMFIGEV
jgi:hypothetical protein